MGKHFEELLNRSVQSNPPNIDLDIIICEKSSRDEITNAIKLLRKKKASGPDSIPAKSLQLDLKTTLDLQ